MCGGGCGCGKGKEMKASEAGKVLAALESRRGGKWRLSLDEKRRKGRAKATVRTVRAKAVERGKSPHGFTPADWRHINLTAEDLDREGESEGVLVMTSRGYVDVAPDGLSHAGRYVPRSEWP